MDVTTPPATTQPTTPPLTPDELDLLNTYRSAPKGRRDVIRQQAKQIATLDRPKKPS